MHLYKQFTDNIKHQHLLQQGDHLLLAVSGGVDSVVLCELCHQAGYAFGIAHANFQLRGVESGDDEMFVRTLADKYKVPVHIRLFETEKYATGKKISIQVAARELRYSWFQELLTAGHRWLLTAHHAGDNIETMLMNFFRGTGISGLRGILPKTGSIVRPLLPFTKEEIILFAEKNSLLWREDRSNDSDKYSRNYFRHNIIPLVKNIYPQAEANLMDNAQRFREIEELYQQSVELHRSKLLERKGTEVHIPVLKLKKAQPLHTIIYEVIREYGFSAQQVTDVIQLLDGEQGKWISSATNRIIKNRNWLIIAAHAPESMEFFIIEEGQPEAANGLLKINSLRRNTDPVSSNPMIAHMDASEIAFPLILRKWKQGDYFYPLGMAKKKKISRFLIDQKLSPTEKENVMVLESNKRICWVAGMRIDDRFKVKPKSKNILEIVFAAQDRK
jgi:tRNA(Ile)-lysidine synthase